MDENVERIGLRHVVRPTRSGTCPLVIMYLAYNLHVSNTRPYVKLIPEFTAAASYLSNAARTGSIRGFRAN